MLHMSEHSRQIHNNWIAVGVTVWISGTIEAVEGSIVHLKVSGNDLLLHSYRANIFLLNSATSLFRMCSLFFHLFPGLSTYGFCSASCLTLLTMTLIVLHLIIICIVVGQETVSCLLGVHVIALFWHWCAWSLDSDVVTFGTLNS